MSELPLSPDKIPPIPFTSSCLCIYLCLYVRHSLRLSTHANTTSNTELLRTDQVVSCLWTFTIPLPPRLSIQLTPISPPFRPELRWHCFLNATEVLYRPGRCPCAYLSEALPCQHRQDGGRILHPHHQCSRSLKLKARLGGTQNSILCFKVAHGPSERALPST